MSDTSAGSSENHDTTVSLEAAMQCLPRLFHERMKQIEDRETDLARREEALQSALGGATPSDVLHLNVGGRNDICVLRRTLTLIDGSMLAIKFCGRWDESLERDQDGKIFIDQDAELFLQLLNYLRHKAIQTVHAPPLVSPPPTPDFQRLVEYYGVTLGVYPVEIVELHDAAPDTCEIRNFPNFSVTSTTFSTFHVSNMGHDRTISSFEVVLDRFSRLQLGWLSVSHSSHVSATNGVGRCTYSVALDATNNVIWHDGSSAKQQNLVVSEGGSIRCVQNSRNSWSWKIEGEEETRSITSTNTHYRSIPCFSLQGSLRITSIVYLSN